MFEEGRFHTAKTGVGGTKVKVSGVNVTPYFSPQDPINANMTADLGALLWKIREAKEAGRTVQMPVIRLAGFAMNYAGSEALVDTLALLHREGADVKVLTDVLNGTSKTSTARVLAEKGVPTAVTDNGVMMHHKFLSIEGGTGRNILWTGSANFTRPAYQENDESVVRIESTAMVRAYQAIFDSLGDNLKERQPFDFSSRRVLGRGAPGRRALRGRVRRRGGGPGSGRRGVAGDRSLQHPHHGGCAALRPAALGLLSRAPRAQPVTRMRSGAPCRV